MLKFVNKLLEDESNDFKTSLLSQNVIIQVAASEQGV